MSAPKVIWQPHPGMQTYALTLPNQVDEVLLGGGRGSGKGFKASEPVLTPRGWKTMGDLRKGSVICNPDGTNQKVVQVFQRGLQDMYQVTFSDGTVIDCDGDHLWFAKIANQSLGKTIRNYKPLNFDGSIYNTEDLHARINKYPNKRPLIPCPEPVKYAQSWKTVVDGYLIGLIIGDGSVSGEYTGMTTVDSEIAEYIMGLGFKKSCKNAEIDYRISNESWVTKQVDALGLRGCHSWDKFIPERLMRGSVNERLSCLQGLMDSDGTADTSGVCSYCTTSLQLATDVRQLILGLGGWATITEKYPVYTHRGEKKQGRLAYNLYIQFPNKVDLFRLTRKKERVINKNYMHGRLVRTIESITKLDKQAETICIVVNNPNRLFITTDFVVTHNSDVMLMMFAQHVGKGHGPAWRGIIFRNSYTALTDLVATSRKWFGRIFPAAKFNGSTHTWKFPDGEELLLRYARVSADYDAYHGWQCPFIFFDEITNWATPELYLKLMSINRCADKNVPRLYGATTNPSGIGARWVKSRFVDVCPPGQFYKDPVTNMTRVYLHSCLDENKTLVEADPTYLDKLRSATEDDENLHKAWVMGEWDLSYGGFFSDIWRPEVHELPNFQIPSSWKVMRSFDWGSAKPWAVSYFAITNGEQPDKIDPDTGLEVKLPYFPLNTTVVFDELYGWNGAPDEGDRANSQDIAERVLEKDAAILQRYGIKVEPSCADTSIYNVADGVSIGQNLSKHGCHWTRAYKGAGSRISGWTLIRTMLGAANRKDLEKEHLYFLNKCFHHIRCFSEIQHDSKNPEDLDTNGEDHILDSLRYGITRRMSAMSRSSVAI